MSFILCNYVLISLLDLVPKMISLLNRWSGHSHSYKSKDNFSSIGVTLRIKTKLPRLITLYAMSLHKIPSFACQLHKCVESLSLYQIQKVSRIHSVTRIWYPTLSRYTIDSLRWSQTLIFVCLYILFKNH